ncbi:AI-2E family transporter [Paenibacillus sediminis]|uniref:PurR-regulated permease PerM n=1 Tax=Paenibacillus sediminis TaxID=664909 RepID=A0ABS4H6X2_9BACL|nr:AI-2E family transporter [Paenibacillus sediminis]MBP1938112.1 putative PurR-regulated permease PerM [Paenibacillus sediminis]
MKFLNEFFANSAVKRIIVLLLIVLFFYVFKSMLNVILITFLLTYLVNRLLSSVQKRISKFMKINSNVLVVLLYVIVLASLAMSTYLYFPRFLEQLNELFRQVSSFYKNPLMPTNNKWVDMVMEYLHKMDLGGYLDQGVNLAMRTISDIGKWSLNLLIAIIMSLFFLLEKERVKRFTAKFKDSKMGFIYDELQYFSKKFVYSFGKVIEVQFLISLVNTILSTIFLWIMGFPNLFVLAMMIFLLGLVPVMGVIVSLIPLCAIAFKIGGLVKVIYILIMILVLHAIEAYFMNPKFMSSKTHLPIFYTFAILIVFEHFFGVWGLILGVPIFMFLLDLLDVSVTNHKEEK